MYSIHSASQSHPGLKRPRNEDFFAIHEPDDLAELQASGRLYLVTDGVGGAAQGDLASQYAAEKVLREYYRSSQLHPGSRLRQAMRQVGNEIYHYAAENLGPVHMATTMVAAAIWEDSLTIANVGDSRAYLIRNEAAQQLTRDHNLASELVRDGVITEEEAQNSPVKSRITRSLGGELDVFVDVFPDIPLRPADRLLLCSDGLTRYARPDDLVRLAVEGSPEEVVKNMVDFANHAGGIDNITIILIEIGEDLSPQDASPNLIPVEAPSAQELQINPADTLPGRALTDFTLRETARTQLVEQSDTDIHPENHVTWEPASIAFETESLADTLRTKREIPTSPADAGNTITAEKSAPPTPPPSALPRPGRRLQPHRPFGRYTPSLILVLALIWLVGMLAVGGYFLFSRMQGDGEQAIATSTANLPVVGPQGSSQPSELTLGIPTESGVIPATIMPSATAPISPTLDASLTLTAAPAGAGRAFCQIAVQPGENLSIITTKLGIALQIEAFKCAAGDNGGCAFDPAQPDALRDGWVMVYPDVERSVCEQYTGTSLETAP